MAGTEPAVASTQLPLAIQLRDEATLENFHVLDAVAALMPQLGELSEGRGEATVYLYGAPATGKSHLLQACCHQVGQRALYLPMAEFVGFEPAAVLESAEEQSLVVVDDLHRVLGDRQWEVALFDLCNRVRAAGGRLLFAAPVAPRQLEMELEDLRSRLSWGLVYQLPTQNDLEKQAILQFRAQRRGLAMPGDVAGYIVSRAPRSLPDLLQILDRLDQQSLAQQRALTIPFVKQVCGW
ncbi:DnaA regulatory inactivator Hda [Haliea sp. E17]|uniref:DnaA regulatory inactivator Hda n=1 Tax=Haliea sp. E17 TaxID=3401576 RepID=UPI003AAE92E6